MSFNPYVAIAVIGIAVLLSMYVFWKNQDHKKDEESLNKYIREVNEHAGISGSTYVPPTWASEKDKTFKDQPVLEKVEKVKVFNPNTHRAVPKAHGAVTAQDAAKRRDEFFLQNDIVPLDLVIPDVSRHAASPTPAYHRAEPDYGHSHSDHHRSCSGYSYSHSHSSHHDSGSSSGGSDYSSGCSSSSGSFD